MALKLTAAVYSQCETEIHLVNIVQSYADFHGFGHFCHFEDNAIIDMRLFDSSFVACASMWTLIRKCITVKTRYVILRLMVTMQHREVTVNEGASPLRDIACHMGSHSVTCYEEHMIILLITDSWVDSKTFNLRWVGSG